MPYYLYRQKNMLDNLENIGWCKPNKESLYNIYIMEEVQTIIAVGAGGSTKLVDLKKNRLERVFNYKFPLEYNKHFDLMLEKRKMKQRFFMLSKNEIVPLEIIGMTNEGNGVGRYDGIAVFVPMTAVGDVIDCRIVKVHKNFCYGIIEKLIVSSDKRIEDNCSAYVKCGGCSFRHFEYEEELRIKEDFVKSSFERIGKINAECEPILGCERTDYYRNKAQYPVAEQEGKAVCGFYSRRSHRVTGTYDCLLQPIIFTNIVQEIMDYINLRQYFCL